MDKNLSVGDKIIYCPPYVTRYSKSYEGVVLSIGTKYAWCKLGFGNKWCEKSDLEKLTTTMNSTP